MQLSRSCSWGIKRTLSDFSNIDRIREKSFRASTQRFHGRTFGTPREWCDASADPPSASSPKADPGLSLLTGLYGVIPGARVMIFGSELHARGFLPSIKGTRALRVRDRKNLSSNLRFPTFLPDLISATESFFRREQSFFRRVQSRGAEFCRFQARVERVRVAESESRSRVDPS